MKLLGILLGLVLMIHITLSVPVDTEENRDTAVPNVQEEDGEPTEEYLAEIRAYLEEQKQKSSTERNTRQISGAINSGDTIALQTYDRSYWLSCYASSCSRSLCPQLHMTGVDWTNCWGEVFKIYRASGSGQVHAGDVVGLYYPRQSGRWLGCAGNNCRKATCPGYPTSTHGFASADHWIWCYGEVFRVYANGKSYGAVINSGDDIMLYYVQGNGWVAQTNGNTRKTGCPGSVRPPPFDRFDICSWENFKIWKR